MSLNDRLLEALKGRDVVSIEVRNEPLFVMSEEHRELSKDEVLETVVDEIVQRIGEYDVPPPPGIRLPQIKRREKFDVHVRLSDGTREMHTIFRENDGTMHLQASSV